MALILRHSRILHTPKCGGLWVNEAIRNSGIFHAHIGGHFEHTNLTLCPGEGLFTIASVRHPWRWWQSYWVFKQDHGWDDALPVDRDCRDDEFERFLVRILEHHPGYCTYVFELYVGAPDREIAFVGRFERLVDDLVLGLTRAGETFDETAIRATPPVNVGRYDAHDLTCSTEVRARILDAERPAFERFGYTF